MERKCCRCFKGKTTSYIDQSYPACVERYWELFSNDEEMVNRYWGIVVEAFKKKRPDIMMEYYMIGGE